jgi:hypothetical protein
MDKKTKIWIISLGIGTAVLISLTVAYRKELKKGLKLGIKKISSFKTSLISNANNEWAAWNNEGKIKEGDPRTMDRLRRYWREGGGQNWSDKRMTDEAWSAVFISWLMKISGAGNDFKYNASHSKYIRASITNRKDNNTNPFKGYKPEEVEVEEGDLVCYARQSGVGYDTTNSYASHCDLVTNINGDAESIGGNVSNSVTKTIVPLTADKKIDRSRDKKKYFVVIKNMK